MWLEEAPFELTDFSPAVSSLRQEREAFSGVFKSNLFKDVGRIYISSQCRVARTDLRELVVLAGGRLVNTARVAEVVVGEFCHVGDSTSPHFVTDHWLLRSSTTQSGPSWTTLSPDQLQQSLCIDPLD